MDIEDLIDTLGVHDLAISHRGLPLLNDEPIEVPPPLPTVSSLPCALSPCAEVSKKRKVDETSIPQIQAMDLYDFEFDSCSEGCRGHKHLSDLL